MRKDYTIKRSTPLVEMPVQDPTWPQPSPARLPRAVSDPSSPHRVLTGWLPSWLGPGPAFSPQACLVIWAPGWPWLLPLFLPCLPCSGLGLGLGWEGLSLARHVAGPQVPEAGAGPCSSLATCHICLSAMPSLTGKACTAFQKSAGLCMRVLVFMNPPQQKAILIYYKDWNDVLCQFLVNKTPLSSIRVQIRSWVLFCSLISCCEETA